MDKAQFMDKAHQFMSNVGNVCDNPKCPSCLERNRVKVSATMVISAIKRGDLVIAETGLIFGIGAIERLYDLVRDDALHAIRAYWVFLLENVKKMDQDRQATLRLALAKQNGLLN